MNEGDPDDERDRPTGSDDEESPPAEQSPSDEPVDEDTSDDGYSWDDDSDEPTLDDDREYAVGGDSDDDESDDGDQSGDGDDESVPDDPTVSGEVTTPAPEDTEPVGISGAPDDQEMPLTAHIEEMIKRLGIVIVVMAIISAIVFPLADRLINFLWYSIVGGSEEVCGPLAAAAAENVTNGTAANVTNGTAGGTNASTANVACPRLYHPISLVLARLKVASLGGFIIALPVFVYQTYLFMRPGLYPNERRYYLASVPTSLILAAIGVAFSYLLVLPIIFRYFLGYTEGVANAAFGLSETFGLILLMLGMFAAIFQIPLFIMLAIMMGVTTRDWLEDRRLYFWLAFAGIAFFFSPDPTGMAPFIVAITMVVLFEGSLLLLRWTGR